MATVHNKIMTAWQLLTVAMMMVMIEVQQVDADNETVCESGAILLEDTAPDACFALVDVAAGPVTYLEAEQKCSDKFTEGRPVFVRNKVSVLHKLNHFLIVNFCNKNSMKISEKRHQNKKLAKKKICVMLGIEILN